MSDYTADPLWQDAHARWAEPKRADETAVEHLERGLRAVFDMYQREREAEAPTP